MVLIKDTIQLLCSIFNEMGLSPPGTTITAEHWRLAKYNKPTVVEIFWKLLQQTIIFQKLLQKHSYLLATSLVKHREILHNLSFPLNITFIKKNMMNFCYQRVHFYFLDIQTSSSIELLIALGWLLASCDIFSYYVFLVKLEIEKFSSFYISPINIIPPFQKISIPKRLNIPNVNQSSCKIDQIFIIFGKLMNCINSISSLHRKRIVLSNLIEKLTKNFSKKSLCELYILSNPIFLQSQFNQMEQWLLSHPHILEIHLHESLFYQWMNSVYSLAPIPSILISPSTQLLSIDNIYSNIDNGLCNILKYTNSVKNHDNDQEEQNTFSSLLYQKIISLPQFSLFVSHFFCPFKSTAFEVKIPCFELTYPSQLTEVYSHILSPLGTTPFLDTLEDFQNKSSDLSANLSSLRQYNESFYHSLSVNHFQISQYNIHS